jgi:glycopeptide antibiotics resistance protein
MKAAHSRFAFFLLIVYSLLMFYWMIFGFGRVAYPYYRYNLIPFFTIRYFLFTENISLLGQLINIAGNIGLFIPFGFLLPLCLNGRLTKALVIFWIAVLLLEFLQLITKRGDFDVDDIILNTLGFLLGYWMLRLSYWLFRRYRLLDNNDKAV